MGPLFSKRHIWSYKVLCKYSSKFLGVLLEFLQEACMRKVGGIGRQTEYVNYAIRYGIMYPEVEVSQKTA
jgi:hypothetical protein